MSNAQKVSELLPCPFCGGEPDVSTYETESLWSHNQVTYTKVECQECDVAFNSEPGYEIEAPAAWNRRTAPTPDAHSEVGVKALEWKPVGWVAALAAPAGFGVWYAINARDPKQRTAPFKLAIFVGTFTKTSISEMSSDGGTFQTVAEAKAAAQTDFAQRVQSCLTAGVVKAEPVAITDEMVELGEHMRMTAEEALLSALADIADFKPTEGAGDPYQQIAVFTKSKAQEALNAWKGNVYKPAALASKPKGER